MRTEDQLVAAETSHELSAWGKFVTPPKEREKHARRIGDAVSLHTAVVVMLCGNKRHAAFALKMMT